MIPTVSLRREWVDNRFFLDDTEITHDQWQKIHDEIEKSRCYPCKHSSLNLADKIDEILKECEKL